MKRYAVHYLHGTSNAVIVLQYPSLETSSLVIVAPLVDADNLPEIAPITPILDYEGKRWMVLTYRLAAIAESDLGEMVTSFEDEDYVFQRAISRLFYGN